MMTGFIVAVATGVGVVAFFYPALVAKQGKGPAEGLLVKCGMVVGFCFVVGFWALVNGISAGC